MDKVRFSCPRCRTIMQTTADKVGFDVACPHCSHRFQLVEQNESSSSSSTDAATLPPQNSPVQQPFQKPIQPVHNHQQAMAQPIQPHHQPTNAYSCPYCQTTAPPIWKSEVSQVGWIVFAILLVTTCVFCFAGLFIRDRYRVCSRCNVRLG